MTAALMGLGVLVALGVGLVWQPRTARWPTPGRARARRRATGRLPAGASAGGGTPDLGAVATEVAARLRAGEDPRGAWERALTRSRGDGRAVARAGVADVPDLDQLLPARRLGRRPEGEVEAQVVALRAAVGLAARVGAPLADVLDRCAAGIAEAGRAEAARRIALAGPASTARLLGWLPVAGVALGWAAGMEPVAVLVDGRLGTAAGLAGLALLVLGRRWSAALVGAARRSGR